MRFMILVKADEKSEAGVLPGEEAREWGRRFPGTDGEIEVRRLYSPDDFDDMRATDRFRNFDLPSQREES